MWIVPLALLWFGYGTKCRCGEKKCGCKKRKCGCNNSCGCNDSCGICNF